jgi:Iap family predicted aminopeptidase
MLYVTDLADCRREPNVEIALIEKEMLGDLWVSSHVWETLAYLCDECHGRFAGTANERRARDYLLARLKDYGLAGVTAEPFEMRGWDRGPARLALVGDGEPLELPCMALPGSHGCDLEAGVIDVGQGSAKDFEKLGTAVAGQIAFNTADGISRTEMYRGAAEAGAAAFIFSGGQPGMLVPTGSITGDMPAIGLAYEGKMRLKRRLAEGPVRARLEMACKVHPVTAYNIVAEIPGTDPGQGWIVAGGHYDGHDIGQAAQDNGAGAAVLVEAARLLAAQKRHLKAGIRFVLFSGEELGLYGSYAYAKAHAGQFDEIRLIFNADVVAMAMPLVLQTQASPELADYFRSLPLRELDATVNDGPNSFIMNSDHFPFSAAGIAGVWAVTSGAPAATGWVHFSADTLDKVEPRLLRQTAATVARLLLRMAAEPDALPRGRRPAAEVQKDVVAAGFERNLRYTGRWPF